MSRRGSVKREAREMGIDGNTASTLIRLCVHRQRKLTYGYNMIHPCGSSMRTIGYNILYAVTMTFFSLFLKHGR